VLSQLLPHRRKLCLRQSTEVVILIAGLSETGFTLLLIWGETVTKIWFERTALLKKKWPGDASRIWQLIICLLHVLLLLRVCARIDRSVEILARRHVIRRLPHWTVSWEYWLLRDIEVDSCLVHHLKLCQQILILTQKLVAFAMFVVRLLGVYTIHRGPLLACLGVAIPV
jgi:hypothetical protein